MRLPAAAVFVSTSLACLAACDGRSERPASKAGPSLRSVAMVNDDGRDAGQWPMASRDGSAMRYSGLTDITVDNVSQLREQWTFSTGVVQGHEAAPVVVGATMYVVTPYPNVLFALDLANRGALKWRYDPKPARAAQGVACCDVVNRGAAFADGKVIFNTLDNHTIAVDADTGEEVWRTRLGDINRGESMTMAPLIADGKVLVGNSGGEFGVRGWIAALQVADGAIAWRAYSTGPDAEVLIGDDFRPFYAQDRGKDLGVTTWPPDMWKIGGGTVWGWVSYDPELRLVFYGTGNPGPWNPEQRPGDNKWTAGIFARDIDTGRARWAYQWSPHDQFDYDGVNENVLIDLDVDGQRRKVLVRPERNGFLYVLDRTSGEVLSADPFVHTTAATGVDLTTGRPIEVEEKKTGIGRVVRDICPAAPGGKDWQPTAYSPRTRLLYIPHNNLCMDMEGLEANYVAGTPFVGARVVMKAGPGGHRGEFTAWDVAARAPAWKIKERFPVWSGTVATAGDVVFYGTMDRWFKAVHARTGEVLWQHQVGSGIIGQPITYRGPDGRQYVAVLSGVGGWAGAIVAGQLDGRDPTAALGFVGAMTDLPKYTARGGTLHVFGLP
jgi:lanthanide-dependent methanol dehydrogenase